MIAALAVLSICGVTTAPAISAQENSSEEVESASDRAIVDLDVDVAKADVATLQGALGEIGTNVADQLAAVDTAQGNLNNSIAALAEADAAVGNTRFLLEDLTIRSDAIVTAAFINPPAEDVLDTLNEETARDATLKQAMLDVYADDDANALTQLQAAREDLEAQKEAQSAARDVAEDARADAELAMANLQDAVSQETQFLIALRQRINDDNARAQELAATNPELAAQLATRAAELQGQMDAIAAAEEAERANDAVAAAEDRAAQAALNGTIVCPVDGPHHFIDTWGAARSGGRTHKGVDIMADFGTPTVAPVSGRVEHRGTSLGGYSWYVYGDDGHTYYGTHLSSYENVGAGWVAAGTVIGYVGSSGNAGSINHLHFEYHPGGGSPVNPFPITSRACEGG
jgi:murein DD-endopeptidase MepM/ murein hydrolase activator NlpD